MAEEGSAGTDPKDAPQQVVTQEQLDKFRSVYDTKITDLTTQKGLLEKQLVEITADLKLLREGVSPDAAKVVEREKLLRKREVEGDEKLKLVEAKEHLVEAKLLAAEAKAGGVEISVEELAKLSDKGEMALAVLRKMTAGGAKPPGKPGRPLPQGSQPGGELRYQRDNLTGALEEYLRKEGRIR